MPVGLQYGHQAKMIIAALLGTAVAVGLLAVPEPVGSASKGSPPDQVSPETLATTTPAPGLTTEILVTATPLSLDGVWHGSDDGIDITYRISGRQIEVISLVYHYGDSFVCRDDPAFQDVEVRQSGSGYVFSLNEITFQGSMAASYAVSGIIIEGSSFEIEGMLSGSSTFKGIVSFIPSRGPVLADGANCLEERRGLAWSATREPDSVPTATMVTSSPSNAPTLTATIDRPGPSQESPEIRTPTAENQPTVSVPESELDGMRKYGGIIFLVVVAIIIVLLLIRRYIYTISSEPKARKTSKRETLTGKDFEILRDALSAAVAHNSDEFASFLRINFNRPLEHYTSRDKNILIQITDVIRRFEADGNVEALFNAARERYPGNRELAQFEQGRAARGADSAPKELD
jgi:Effector-associated domain 1